MKRNINMKNISIKQYKFRKILNQKLLISWNFNLVCVLFMKNQVITIMLKI